MRTCWFVVIESVGHWWVDCEGKTYGPFEGEREARTDAVRIAQAYGDPRRQSVVYAPEPSHHHEPIWAGPLPQRR